MSLKSSVINQAEQGHAWYREKPSEQGHDGECYKPGGTGPRLVSLKSSEQGHDDECYKQGGTGPRLVSFKSSVINQAEQGHAWYREKPSVQGHDGECYKQGGTGPRLVSL